MCFWALKSPTQTQHFVGCLTSEMVLSMLPQIENRHHILSMTINVYLPILKPKKYGQMGGISFIIIIDILEFPIHYYISRQIFA